MDESSERAAWAVVALGLAAGAIPWFLWRSDVVVAGLPLWVWWHVGWMGLASVVFYAFTQRGWGVWVLPGGAGSGTADARESADVEGGTRGR